MDETTIRVLALMLAHQELQMIALASVLAQRDDSRPFEEQYQEALLDARKNLAASVSATREQIRVFVKAVEAKSIEELHSAIGEMDAMNQLFLESLESLRRDPPPTD